MLHFQCKILKMGWLGIVRDHSRSLESGNSAIWWSAYEFLLAFCSNYFALFLRQSKILVENRRL